MAPSRRKGANKTTTVSTRRQWKIGDPVLAKVKGFPAWPATVTEPEKWGYSADWKKVLVYFFGTQQIAFCNPADVEEFTEEKKQSLLGKCHGKGADFVRAVNEIIDCFDKLKKQAQVNSCNGTEEVNITNENNSEESLSKSVKDEASSNRVKSLNAGATTNDHYSLTEASVVAAAEDALQDGELRSSLMFAETPAPVTCSIRSKADVTRSRNCVAQRISARRLRSSSRLDASQLQNLTMPSINNKRSSRCSGTNSLRNRSLRRSKRIMKSPDKSDGYDIDSPFVSNDSIEESDSEIMTGDSDSFSFNDGCAVDSVCKTMPSEPCVQSYAEEMEMEFNNRLDFQTNTAISKKRRKSDKKRHCSDTVMASKLDLVVSDVEVLKTECCSLSNSGKFSETCAMDDGDEHLPLVKRARIRMGRPSPTGKEDGTLAHKEEKSLKVSKGLVIQSSGCLNYKVDDPLDEDSVPIKEDPQNLSLSPASPAKLPQPWETRKNNVVGEATLPPTKRLHRALEAMSANVVEDSQGASNCFPTEDIHCNGDFSMSLGDCSELSMRSEAVIGLVTAPLMDHGKDDCQLSIAEFHVAGVFKNVESVSVLESDCGKTSYVIDGSNHELVESAEDADSRCLIVSPSNVKHAETDAVQSPSNERSAEADAANQHLTPELPNLGEELSCLDRNTPDLSMVPTESCKIECSELKKPAKRSDPEISQMNSGSILLKEIADGSLDIDTSVHIDITDCNGDEALKMQQLFLADNNQSGLMSHLLNEVRPLSMDSNTLPSTNPSKDMTSGQNQGLLHSIYIADDNLKDKNVTVARSSSSLTDKPDSVVQASPPSSSICNMPASDNKIIENNSSCSPDIPFHLEKAKLAGKSSSKRETLSSFEAIISSLTRTKESIGRATRIAIDCAKSGFATKVVEILARNLESESSLHRKVDLFFLVDSITQRSRGIKGDGGMYPSAIQALLPRLLLAAAPPGGCSLENHRQCLKVLRVWQERKILPEPIIRPHIRELDALCVSYPMGVSRRPLRNERAFDDPIREMEGMLVDEYGSNSSFQLPGFCMPPMLRDDDGGIDSDGENFEAVTPEHYAENLEVGKILTPTVEKHCHILEDVDGELEMEDLAPCCEVEITSTGNIGGLDHMQMPHHQSDNHNGASYTCQLPKDVPLPSAPLLSSPSCPPFRPPPSAFPPAVLDSFSKGPDSKIYSSSQKFSRNLHESMVKQSSFSRVKPTNLDAVHHRAHNRKEFVAQVPRQIDESNNSRSFTYRPASNLSGQASNSIHQADGAFSKGFHLRPPLPSPSNQFSYVQERVQLRRDIPPPSHANRFRARNAENVNFYRDRERNKFVPSDNIGECWGPPLPFISGPGYHDGARMAHTPMSYGGPPRKPASPHNRWNFPTRLMNRRHFTPYRTPFEGPIPVAHRGPNYWRPR